MNAAFDECDVRGQSGIGTSELNLVASGVAGPLWTLVSPLAASCSHLPG